MSVWGVRECVGGLRVCGRGCECVGSEGVCEGVRECVRE